MDQARRLFFRRAGLIAAAPAVGIAKVIGIKPAIAAPATFGNGEILTAEMLNEEFSKIREQIRQVA